MTKKIYHTSVREIIQNCEEGFVEFQKADGTLRPIFFRKLDPKKDVKGTGQKVIQNNYTNVFDIDAEGIRCVTHNRVKRMKVNGVEYTVVPLPETN